MRWQIPEKGPVERSRYAAEYINSFRDANRLDYSSYLKIAIIPIKGLSKWHAGGFLCMGTFQARLRKWAFVRKDDYAYHLIQFIRSLECLFCKCSITWHANE